MNRTIKESVNILKEINKQYINHKNIDKFLFFELICFFPHLTGEDLKGDKANCGIHLCTSDVKVFKNEKSLDAESYFENIDFVFDKITFIQTALRPGYCGHQNVECSVDSLKIKNKIEELVNFFNIKANVSCTGSPMNPDRNSFFTEINLI